MRNTLHQIKDKKGFSIAELLVAILILSMVSAVVAGGIPVARDAYNKITVSANAQVMLSTTISALRNELGTASAVYINRSSGEAIVYRSGKNGNISKIYKGTYEDIQDAIMIHEYYDPDESDAKKQKTKPRLLVPETDDLYATFDGFTLPIIKGDNIVIINGLTVKKKEGKSAGVAENAPSVNESIGLSIRGIGKLDNYVSPESTG